MSLPEDSLVPKSNIPPVLPENISANTESANPYSSPKALEASEFTGLPGKAAALGVGYWVMVVASLLVTIFALTQEPFTAIPLGWVAFFAALRVPLRDTRRNMLNRSPIVRRTLYGAGDYLLSLVLSVGLSFAMCTVFLTVCTVTGLGLGGIAGNEADMIPLAMVIGGILSLVSFLLLFSISLRL